MGRVLEKSFKKWYKPWLEDVEVAQRGRRQRGEQELRTGGVVCKEGTPRRASIRVGQSRCRARRKKKRNTMMIARAKKRRKTVGRTIFGRGGGRGARMRGGGGERRGGSLWNGTKCKFSL